MNQNGGFRRLATMLDAARELPPPPETSRRDGSDSRPAKISGIPLRRATDTFGTFDLVRNKGMGAALEQCRKAAKGEAWSALLAGPPGTGKTHLAIAAGNAFEGPVLFWKVPDLLARLRRAQFEDDGLGAEKLIDLLQTDRIPGLYGQTTGGQVELRPPFQMRRLLILDDLGAENPTDWAHEQLYRVLDARYDNELPTILTTNQPRERLDPRLLSRYIEGLVVCKGVDVRRLTG